MGEGRVAKKSMDGKEICSQDIPANSRHPSDGRRRDYGSMDPNPAPGAAGPRGARRLLLWAIFVLLLATPLVATETFFAWRILSDPALTASAAAGHPEEGE